MDEKKSKQAEIQSWANLSRSVLNGVVGDYLVRENNPLAIEMAFYHHDRPLILDDTLPTQMAGLPGSDSTSSLSNKIVVLVHGLTNLETVWNLKHTRAKAGQKSEGARDSLNSIADSDKDNYGLRLQRDFGFTPLFLRYNTGQSIQENSRKFADLISSLCAVYPIPVDEIVLMGFSMGGLLIRGAQKIAQDESSPWISRLSNCYYIGTPHEGSPLEKFGHLSSSIVRLVPRDYINHWADWIDIRSEGIRDLKDGLMHLKDKSGKETKVEQDDPYEQSARCGSFFAGAQHHFVSGALSENKDSLLNKLFGDSLVRHSSANPISAPEDSKTAHFPGIPHIPLAHSNRVYRQIRQWFDEHERKVELKYFDERGAVTQARNEVSESQGLTNQEILAGTMDLLVTAYDQTLDAVSKVHHSIAGEPYSVLGKVPVVKEFSRPISKSHKDILDTIYFSLKEGGKLAHKGVRLITPGKQEIPAIKPER